jgi:hypothetical protein
MSADEGDWFRGDVTQKVRHYDTIVSYVSENACSDPAPKHMFEGPNLGLVILAVVKANGDGGAIVDAITQAVLRLSVKLKFEPLASQPSLPSRISRQVEKIVVKFRSRGFFTGIEPARLTADGEAWLNRELSKRFSSSTKLDEFWSAVADATGTRKCPHCHTLIRFSANACNICPACGQRSCDV